MPELTFPTTFTAAILKSTDLPDDVVKAAQGQDVDHYFYASVETKDLEGDVLRVKGMRTAEHVPFLVGHKLKANDDGTLPVIGKTVGWHRTVHKSLGVPAFVAGVKFAPTRLGQEFKKQYDEGFLSAVSVGIRSPKGKAIRDGRFDIEECEIFELSACVKGVNEYASIVKALDLDNDGTRIDTALSRIDSAADKFEKAVEQRIKKINSTVDDLESAIVAKAHGSDQPGDNDSDVEAAIDYAPLESALTAVLSQLRK